MNICSTGAKVCLLPFNCNVEKEAFKCMKSGQVDDDENSMANRTQLVTRERKHCTRLKKEIFAFE